MNEFNDYCLKRIRETGQFYKLEEECACEIEPDCLYMGECYEAASFIIPQDKIILDLGCFMSAQAFLFEDHAGYIGFDMGKQDRFVTGNITSTRGDLNTKDYMNVLDDLHINPEDCYVLMNAVPVSKETVEEIWNTFSHITIAYPGRETKAKGIYADKMVYFTNLIHDSRSPYVQFYLNKNPEEKAKYEKLHEQCVNEIKDYMCNSDYPDKFFKEDDLDEMEERF